ncbi:DoxX-like family protein [Litchfieldia alkalitelluris]|uniref:DoxX-like family protein n=1 Tax=Litchfieldia alkalitelluris TaxID=304268 RepID=UPI000996E4BB|nr:DoxX-like family protein [Litchfieldia alkalitelluris]
MKRKPIYVEIPIQTEMDKLWEATQTPELHEQWDRRFSSITYLPKKDNEPQHFSYKTNIGFGLAIEGWGRSVGSYHGKDGSRTSSLHFGTDQKLSIIREGKGFWKYQQNQDDITFLTQYDYQPKFGILGQWIDTLSFRPLMGWGTALSFDVLKRWLEKGETPFSQYVRFFSYWTISICFMVIWLYHGLIPKLIYMHQDEVAMVQEGLSLSLKQAMMMVNIIGIGEVIFSVVWLLVRKRRRLFGLQMILFPLLTVSAVISNPTALIHPFNPLTFNLALFILSVIGFMISKDIPTARNCIRKR